MIKKKIKLSFIFMVLTLVLFSSATVFAAQSNPTIKRLSGDNRYATSEAVALSRWTQSDYAILAYGEDFPDALSAASLAKKYNAPILLTEANSIPKETLDTIRRLAVKNIIIVGGTSVISAEVQKQLGDLGMSTTRIYGQNRYETSIKIAEQLDNVNEIAIVTGENFPDALSISPIAVKKSMPIILVQHNSIPNVVTNFIRSHKLTKIYVVGLGTSLDNSILTGLSNVELITGNNMYEINLSIIDKFKNDLDFNTVYLATGSNFADALSGSVLAGLNSNPLVLVGDNVKIEKDYFDNNFTNISNINILGGKSAITDEIVNELAPTNTQTPVSAVEKVEFVSTELTSINANTATFTYKISDKDGNDITKVIPASYLTATCWVGTSKALVSLDPLTGTGTVTYKFSYSDKSIRVQIVCNNGKGGSATIFFKEIDTRISEIDITSTNLTRNGENIATFKYKILNKQGQDITDKIPASQLSSFEPVTLDPSTGTGTITLDPTTIHGLSIDLTDKISGKGVNSNFDSIPDLGASDTDKDPRLSKIAITTRELVVSNGVGYAAYRVEDQFENDITELSLANNLTFKCDIGKIESNRRGLITIIPNDGVDFSRLDTVTITCSDPSTGISTNATLIVNK